MNIQNDTRAAPNDDADLPFELERRLLKLNQRYVQCLDANRLVDWPDFFTENGLYRIYPRENLDAGLPACLLLFDNRAAMRDRILCLTEVSLFANNVSRHFLGPSAIRAKPDGSFAVVTNVLVVHSDIDGNSRIFCAGEYRDLIVEQNGALKFSEKTVVLDTFNVPSHLAAPV